MTPFQLGPPLVLGGKRPTRCVTISKISLGISEASLIQAPVNSKDLNLPVSLALSKARKSTSSSSLVPSPISTTFIVAVIGVSQRIWAMFDGNQVSQVLMVVLLSSGYVLRMIAQRERLTPRYGFCLSARATISTQQLEDLPDPTGPMRPRTKAFDA